MATCWPLGLCKAGSKLWDPHSGALLATLEGHANSVTSICFSNEGKRVLSGSADGTIKIWSVRDRRLIATMMTGGPANGSPTFRRATIQVLRTC
ncbi:MAG: WD40 repeat domain-containing protein [Bryobacteraceae bacterium]